jgi:hypothetical protein
VDAIIPVGVTEFSRHYRDQSMISSGMIPQCLTAFVASEKFQTPSTWALQSVSWEIAVIPDYGTTANFRVSSGKCRNNSWRGHPKH